MVTNELTDKADGKDRDHVGGGETAGTGFEIALRSMRTALGSLDGHG